MSELDNLEALRRRKEQLLLEQEVAQLERKKKLEKVGAWRWFWIAPLTALGLFFTLAGLGDGMPAIIAMGLILLVPAGLKLKFSR